MSLQATFPGPTAGGIRIDINSQVGQWETQLIQSLRTLLATAPFARARQVWISGIGPGIDDTFYEGTRPLVTLLGALPGVEELYVANEPGTSTPLKFLASLGDTLPGRTTPFPFATLHTLYVFVYDEDELQKRASMLQARAEGGRMVRHLLYGGDEPGTYKYSLKDWSQVHAAVGKHVEKLTILGEGGYWQECSLRKVLPPMCIEHSYHTRRLWPAWVEGKHGVTDAFLMNH